MSKKIVFSGYPRELMNSGVFDAPLFESARRMRSSTALLPGVIAVENTVIVEGIVRSGLKKLLHLIIGNLAEYGGGAIGGITTLGPGSAIGPTLETTIDLIFTSESLSEALASVKEIAKSEKFSSLLNESINIAKNGSSNFDQIYSDIGKLVQKELSSSDKSHFDDLQGQIKNLLSDLTEPVANSIQTMVPEPNLGLVLGQLVKQSILGVQSKSYDLFTGGIKKVESKAGPVITDPTVAPQLYSEAIDKIVEILSDLAQKIKDVSWAKLMVGTSILVPFGGPIVAPQLKLLGVPGLEKTVDFIKEEKPTLVKLVQTIVDVVFPTTIAMTAIYQTLATEDYKKS